MIATVPGRPCAASSPRLRSCVLVLTSLLLAAPLAARAADPVAESVYRHGVVYTADAKDSFAQALAVAAGRIVYVGTDAGVERLIGPKTQVVDLKGRMLMPGLVDGHMHPLEGGTVLLKCSLEYASLTVAEFQARIRACLDARAAAPKDAWLEVAGWLRYGMRPKGDEVTRATVDVLPTERPIVVHDSFGHTSLANSRALALAKIGAATRDPVGGRLDRDSSGTPTGILEDAAQEPVASLIPKPTKADNVAAAGAALDALRRQGVTTFLDAVGEPADIEAFAELARAGVLTARAHFAPPIRPA